MSSGCPARPSGVCSMNSLTPSRLLARVAAFSGVSIKPGPIALTRTPSLPSSTASARPRAPTRAWPIAMARPMPEPAPVMTAMWLARRGMGFPRTVCLSERLFMKRKSACAKPHHIFAIVLRNFVQQEVSMKSLAFGFAAVLGLAMPAAAGTVDRVHLAQAAPSGSGQSGAAGDAARTSGGRDGAATSRDSARSSGAGGADRAAESRRDRDGGRMSEGRRDGDRMGEGRREGSRTSIRTNVRIGERDGVRSRVRYGSRTTIHARYGSSDEVYLHRKKARRYVHSEPAVIIRRKKARRYVYDEPSRVSVSRRYRSGVVVRGGESARVGVSVRSRTTRATVGERSGGVRGSVSVNERSSTMRSSGGGSATGRSGSQSAGGNAGGTNTVGSGGGASNSRGAGSY